MTAAENKPPKSFCLIPYRNKENSTQHTGREV